jgi:SAM-dependent methyltransferase
MNYSVVANGCLVSAIACALSFAGSKDPQLNAEKLISNELYNQVNGFSIGEDERSTIHAQGGNATYGEITYAGAQELLDDLKLTKKDIFYDLGSGVGKLVTQVALNTPVAKAVGVELSPTRFNHAMDVKKEIEKRRLLKNTKLSFLNENILTVPVSDATVVFMCSTCFSDELMRSLTDKLSKLKKGARILTLRKMPEPHPFTLIKTYQLPMTWAHNTAVYLYQLTNSIDRTLKQFKL